MATRKRVLLTLDCKVKVIRQHEKGIICSRQLAAEFGVGKTQINNIVTAKADILKLWDDGVNGRRKFFFFVIRHSFTIEDLVSAPNLKLGCAVILRGCASDYK